MSKWDGDRLAILERRLKAGDSASEIASGFGDVSRNAVIGAAHRAGFQFKRSQGVNKPKRQRFPGGHANCGLATKVIRDVKVARRRHSQVEPTVNPQPFACQPLPDVRQRLVGLLDLNAGECKWTDSDGVPFLFCGRAAQAGLPYCAEHARVAYPPRVARTPMSEEHKAKLAVARRRAKAREMA